MGIGNWFKGLVQKEPNVHVLDERPPIEEVDALYKTKNSSAHTFYVATKRPRGHGKWSSFGKEIKLAGQGSHQVWAKTLEEFFLGDKRWISFKRDRHNEYDPFAIEVYGIWIDRISGKLNKKRIGWVESLVSEELAKRMERTTIIGTPSIFFYGKSSSGLRFRVWTNIDEENESYTNLLNSLLHDEGTTVSDASKQSGFEKTQIRNWLDKLSKGQIVTAPLMEAFSGYRIEKTKKGREVLYKGMIDESNQYVAKKGMTDEQINDDPMGADIPDYVFEPIDTSS